MSALSHQVARRGNNRVDLVLPSSALRVAEQVWLEGVLIKDFAPEAFTIKNIDDSWALLKVATFKARLHFHFSQTEDGLGRMEDSIRQWMKDIQDLLLESEQLRVESDTNGPQVIV